MTPVNSTGQAGSVSAANDLRDSLSHLRQRAPAGFTGRVMNSLPDARAGIRRFAIWPRGRSWVAPALAGAAAAVIMTLYFSGRAPLADTVPGTVVVQFELHAPQAGRVELVGDFTAWLPGGILLEGPDESGHWTAQVELPAGRHEYLFLVDGREWITDPRAKLYRPDGFGNFNAVLIF